jgi:Ras association domain-containing protein 2/4
MANSKSLPSKLDVKKIEWDEIDELLQVQRQDDLPKYSTMSASLSTSMTDSQISNISMDSDTLSFKTLSPEVETTSQSSSLYYSQMDSSNEQSNDESQPCDFEDFKREADRNYLSGANEMPNVDDKTLKFNQPIDP